MVSALDPSPVSINRRLWGNQGAAIEKCFYGLSLTTIFLNFNPEISSFGTQLMVRSDCVSYDPEFKSGIRESLFFKVKKSYFYGAIRENNVAGVK